MQDYFYPCHKLESKMIADGFGGFEMAEYVGIEFRGLAVKRGSAEQLIGALRGKEQTQYTFHCPIEIPLEKSNKVMYNEKGVTKYIILTSSGEINTEKSTQTDWKTYSAERYTPTTIIKE